MNNGCPHTHWEPSYTTELTMYFWKVQDTNLLESRCLPWALGMVVTLGSEARICVGPLLHMHCIRISHVGAC